MKYCFAFLFLLPLSCFAQHATISATKMNVLYIGIENPISFAAENTMCNEVMLIVANGTAKRAGECDYSVSVTKPGTTLLYLVKGIDTIYRVMYRVKKIPDPVTDRVDNKSYIHLDSLRFQNSLKASPNYDFDASFSIIKFDITVYRKKKFGGDKKIYCDECFKKIETDYHELVFSETIEGADFSSSWKAFIRHHLSTGGQGIF